MSSIFLKPNYQEQGFKAGNKCTQLKYAINTTKNVPKREVKISVTCFLFQRIHKNQSYENMEINGLEFVENNELKLCCLVFDLVVLGGN